MTVGSSNDERTFLEGTSGFCSEIKEAASGGKSASGRVSILETDSYRGQ